MKPWILLTGLLVLVMPALAYAQEATPTEEVLACDAATDYIAQGGAAMDKQDYAAALESYACAIELKPQDAQAYARHSEAAMMAGRYSLVDRDYTYIHRQLMKDDGALQTKIIADYDNAIAAAPDDIPFHLYRGYAHTWDESDNALDLAAADFQYVVVHDPENRAAPLYAAFIQVLSGATDQGWLNLSKAVEQDAKNPDAYYLKAIVAQIAMKWPDLLDSADQAAALSFDSVDLTRLRAVGLSQTGDLAGGAAEFVDYFDRVGPTRIDAGTLKPSETLVATLAPYQTAVMTFDVTDKHHVTLRTQSMTDPMIVLLGPDGTPIQGNDDTDNAYNDADSRINVTLPEGHYTLLMTTYYGYGHGDIRVLLAATTH